MLHEILNLSVEIMRDRRLAPSFVYLTITESSFVRLYGSTEKKIQKLDTLSRGTQSPFESK